MDLWVIEVGSLQLGLIELLALIISGIIAGFVNTLAGGGSIFTLPALMLLGMPADVANGTNRVGVFLQSVAAVRGFNQHGKLATQAIVPILVPTVIGSLAGSIVASYLPVDILKPVLIFTMIAMTLVIILKPSAIPAEHEIPLSLTEKPAGIAWLFVAGLYGGFVQAGVGFILIAALAGVLRYDLVRANALKMVCTLVFGTVALAVFVVRDQVMWIPGLIMGVATIIGVQLSVKFAVNAQHATLKWILLGMSLIVCIAALLKA
ncbi:MAG: sulfite exporter TauE/SafE family protein [Pseudomonadales bacterium]|nr:sulfite exporter TauE/SafE family protein [Pseudomonadales bacterium]